MISSESLSLIRTFLRDSSLRFFRDEDAQAAIEYVLILSVMVTIAILLMRDLIRPVMDRLSKSTKALIENTFKPGESMHRLPFKR